MSITGVWFQRDELVVTLRDSRELVVPLHRYEWLKWLQQATPAQRERWTLEPNGFAIYWDELDDGIEVEHVLSLASLG